MNCFNTEQPLAYAYLKDGKVYYEIHVPWSEVYQYMEVDPGIGLMDFTWLKGDMMREVYRTFYRCSTEIKMSVHDNKKVAEELYAFAGENPLFRFSSIFHFLVVSIIEVLSDDCYDPRIMFVLDFFQKQKIDMDNLAELAKLDQTDINLYPQNYTQAVSALNVQLFCDQIWIIQLLQIISSYQGSKADQFLSACQWLKQTEKVVKKYVRFDFSTVYRETVRGAGEYVAKTILTSIEDVLRYEVFQSHFQNVKYRYCTCCNSYFVPTGRSDAIYCNRPDYSKGGRTCIELGANQNARKRRAKTPPLRIYRQAYIRMYRRMENGSLSNAEFAEWEELAQNKRDQCLKGEMGAEEFLDWINQTSRLRPAADAEQLLTPLPVEDNVGQLPECLLEDIYF